MPDDWLNSMDTKARIVIPQKNKKDFQSSLAKSLGLHLLILLLLAIIPLSQKLEKPDYIEVSMLKGENEAPKSEQKNKAVKSLVTQPKQNNPKKTVNKPTQKKISPVKLPETTPSKKVLPAKSKLDINERINKKAETEPSANIKTQVAKTNIDTEVIEAGPASSEAVTGNLNLSGPIASRQVLYIVRPDYPNWAAEQGIETDVTLKFWVTPEGNVKEANVIQRSGYLELDIIAKRSLQHWLFDPLDKRLPQKDQWGQVVIKFRLE